MTNPVTRRRFLVAAALVAPTLATPLATLAASTGSRELDFFHAHTSERLKLVYWEAGNYIADALVEIDHLLRDFRTSAVHPIDPGVLDMLYAARERLGGNGRFEILSGYRSPKTNKMLAATHSGVAKQSLHMAGRALDFRLGGVEISDLRVAALELRAGGVGYYPKSNFIHVDTGRFRSWQGAS